MSARSESEAATTGSPEGTTAELSLETARAVQYLRDFIAYEPGTTTRPQREKAEGCVKYLVAALRSSAPAPGSATEAIREALEKLREPCTPTDRGDARVILQRALREDTGEPKPLLICAGCQVRPPFEHRCHGGECSCPECACGAREITEELIRGLEVAAGLLRSYGNGSRADVVQRAVGILWRIRSSDRAPEGAEAVMREALEGIRRQTKPGNWAYETANNALRRADRSKD